MNKLNIAIEVLRRVDIAPLGWLIGVVLGIAFMVVVGFVALVSAVLP